MPTDTFANTGDLSQHYLKLWRDFPEDFRITHPDPSINGDLFLVAVREDRNLRLKRKLGLLVRFPGLSPVEARMEIESLLLSSLKQQRFDEETRKSEWKTISRLCSAFGDARAAENELSRYGVPTPKALHALLGELVIGQDSATRRLVVPFYNQSLCYLKAVHPGKIRKTPAHQDPVLMIGPTGCGKTLTVRALCNFLGLPFVHVNTSGMVEEGIVGYSIGDIGREALTQCGDDLNKAQRAVVFLDELDKLFLTPGWASQSITSQLLRVVEGTKLPLRTNGRETWTPPAESIETGGMLFVFGGAFQRLYEDRDHPSSIGFQATPESIPSDPTDEELIAAGVPRELMGRIGTTICLDPLRLDALTTILKSKSSPIMDENHTLSLHNLRLEFDDEALEAIAKKALEQNVGARGLKQVVSLVFEEYTYLAPSEHYRKLKVVKVTADEVRKRVASLKRVKMAQFPKPPTATRDIA